MNINMMFLPSEDDGEVYIACSVSRPSCPVLPNRLVLAVRPWSPLLSTFFSFSVCPAYAQISFPEAPVNTTVFQEGRASLRCVAVDARMRRASVSWRKGVDEPLSNRCAIPYDVAQRFGPQPQCVRCITSTFCLTCFCVRLSSGYGYTRA